MNKEFCPYEIALELKKLKFDEPCFGAYGLWGFMSPNDVNSLSDQITQEDLDNENYDEEEGVCLAPLYQQCWKWFREKYNIDGFIQIEPLNKKYGYVTYDRKKGNYTESERKYTPEEAELACLKKLIEIVKK